MKGSILGKKAYAISKYDTITELLPKLSYYSFSPENIRLATSFPTFHLSLCVLTHDNLRTPVGQNLHVESFFILSSSVNWPSKTNTQAPVFQTWRRAPVPQSLSDFSNHIHWCSRRCCLLLQTLSRQIFKEQVRSGKCSVFIPFPVLFHQFSAVNISIFDKRVSVYIASSCGPAFNILLTVTHYLFAYQMCTPVF